MSTKPLSELEKQDLEEKKKEDRRRFAELITLGRDGKLWTIELTYQKEDNSVGLIRIINMTGKELMQYRQNMFSVGILQPFEADHWRIIAPREILTVDVWRQADYFKEI